MAFFFSNIARPPKPIEIWEVMLQLSLQCVLVHYTTRSIIVYTIINVYNVYTIQYVFVSSFAGLSPWPPWLLVALPMVTAVVAAPPSSVSDIRFRTQPLVYHSKLGDSVQLNCVVDNLGTKGNLYSTVLNSTRGVYILGRRRTFIWLAD